MYDWPELRQAHDTVWEAIRDNLQANGIGAPERLCHDGQQGEDWLDPQLLLSQTCGYPFATALAGKVQYVATPVYQVEGCRGAEYSSVIVARQAAGLSFDKLRGLRFAYNDTSSLSGYMSVRHMVGRLERFFGELLESGGHRQSARMVAAGEADIAALDAVCWHMFKRYDPDIADALTPIGWTKMRPALPFITSLQTSSQHIAALRAALSDVFSKTGPRSACRQLTISGIELVEPGKYAELAKI